MNGDIQYDLTTLALNNGEQIEDFHIIFLRLKQEIALYGETVSPTRFLFQYMKALSNIYKLKALIVPNMTYIITLPNNNGKYAVYIGVNINGIYLYLEIIQVPKKITTSVQRSHHLIHSPSINNYIASLLPVIAALRMIQKIICKVCVRIGHKDDACIIHCPKFLPPKLNHQESGTSNIQKINSNPEPLIPTLALYVELSWEDLIVMPLIMVMLSFTLQSLQLNLTLNLF